MGDDSASGGREPTVSDSELLELFDDADVPVQKTSELAEKISIGERQVRARLQNLSEDDRVGSRMITAQNRVRLWWHSRIGVKQAWTSTGSSENTIGVEIVDSLELPGRGNELRHRRQAVNSVFKYLFDQEEATAGSLKLVAWGAAPDSYASPESFWNNCVKKALDQSRFVRLFVSDKEWKLTEMAFWLQRKNNRAPWNDWDIHRDWLDQHFHYWFWEHLIDSDVPFDNLVQNHTSVFEELTPEMGIDWYYRLDMTGPVSSDSSGALSTGLLIQEQQEVVQEILNSRERIETSLDFQIEWHGDPDNQSNLAVIRTRSLDVDPNEVFKDETSRPLLNLQKWIEDTHNQFLRVVEDEVAGI